MSVRPVATASIASRIRCSLRPSSDDVDSSSSRIGGAASSARAIARRWRSPPESITPLSPTGRVDAERVALEHLAEVHRAQHALAVVIGCLGRGEPQVVGDRAGEGRGILLDVAELRAQVVAVERADVAAVEQDRAVGRVVEALDERERRALARAGRTDERDARAARHGERHAAQHVAVARRRVASTASGMSTADVSTCAFSSTASASDSALRRAATTASG